eukprot:7705096-Pyramimonas_sp.AAC.1
MGCVVLHGSFRGSPNSLRLRAFRQNIVRCGRHLDNIWTASGRTGEGARLTSGRTPVEITFTTRAR